MGGACATIFTQKYGDLTEYGVVTFGAPATKHQTSGSSSVATTPASAPSVITVNVGVSTYNTNYANIKDVACPFCSQCQLTNECCGDTFSFTYNAERVYVRRTGAENRPNPRSHAHTHAHTHCSVICVLCLLCHGAYILTILHHSVPLCTYTDTNDGWGQNLKLSCMSGNAASSNDYDTATFNAWTPATNNRFPPKGYFVPNGGNCLCRGNGVNMNSCGDVCCPGSPSVRCWQRCPDGSTSRGDGVDWHKCVSHWGDNMGRENRPVIRTCCCAWCARCYNDLLYTYK